MNTAWIIVDIGERAWAQLAYQFGHELGHVLANSWQANARPGPPCQWLEEAMVEAFSLRGLGQLARAWKATPPFAGDNAYGDAIAGYRQNVIDKYRQLAVEQGGIEDFGAWFARLKGPIEAEGGLNAYAQAAAPVMLAEYERTPRCVEALGALNRWPGRTRVSLADYLRDWEASCHQTRRFPGSAVPTLKGATRVLRLEAAGASRPAGAKRACPDEPSLCGAARRRALSGAALSLDSDSASLFVFC